jgi:hypothetical protein
MENFNISIVVTPEGKVSFQCNQPIQAETLTQILTTVLLNVYRNVVKSAPIEHKKEVSDAVYDMFNVTASNLLTQFDPTSDLRPDLTAEAIKKAEDEILTTHFNSLTPEQQNHFKEQKEKMLCKNVLDAQHRFKKQQH